MPSSTPGGLPFPLSSEPIKDGAEAIEDLAVAVDGRFVSGLRANRPAAGVLGRQYLATDTHSVFLDTGTDWVCVTVPPGTVAATGAPSADVGWVLAQGQLVSRTGVYADVFSRFGVQYGAGNGSTTFQLPDLRARVPVGAGGGRSVGQTGGSETHTLTPAETATVSHTHAATAHANYRLASMLVANGGVGIEFIGRVIGGAAPLSEQSGAGKAIDGVWPTVAPSGGVDGASHNNMQPYQVVNWLIKL